MYPLSDQFAPDHVHVIETHVEESSPIFDVRHDTIRFQNGDVATRDIVTHQDAVGIVALRNEEHPEILLIRQYRHPMKQMMWEIPAGLCDHEGETPVETAARELAEEAQLSAQSWEELVSFASSPGFCTERVTIFLAKGISKTSRPRDFVLEGEEVEIETRWVALHEVVDAVLAGQLTSPSLVIGALAAAQRFS
ncbi:NUDIX domain-containing protein [Arcanobacterium canis]